MNELGQAQQLTYEVLWATWGKQSKEASFRLCIVPPHKWCNANTLDNEYVISGSSLTWPCTAVSQQFLDVNLFDVREPPWWNSVRRICKDPFGQKWPRRTRRWRTQLIRVESVCVDRNPLSIKAKGVPCEAYIQLHNLIKLKTHKLGLVWRLDSYKNPQSSLFSDYPSFWFYFWRERTVPLFLLSSVCLDFGFFAP